MNSEKTTPLLEVEDLHVSVAGKEVLKGLSLTVRRGEIHVLLGQNGTGKSTLAFALAGRPGYEITAGRVRLDGEDLLSLVPEERARRGLFLAFQNPPAVPGVSVANFLRTAYQARFQMNGDGDKAGAGPVGESGGVKNGKAGGGFSIMAFQKSMLATMKRLKIDVALASRYLNDGFSGGEKKRVEVLQLAVLKPRLALLDETDSGLDIDALRTIGEAVDEQARKEKMGVLVITHYKRLLDYIRPDFAHLLTGGRITVSDGPELVDELEQKGFDGIRAAHSA